MPATRTDVHSPTNMDPANYEFVVCIDSQSPWVLRMGDWGMELSRKISRDDFLGRGTHQCHHCGAHIRYGAILRHTPTDTLIVVGETCLDNRFSLVSKAQFDALRKAAALDRAKQRIKTQAAEFVEALSNRGGDFAVAATALDRNTDLEALGLEGWALSTTTDIRMKLWDRYGNLSDKQVALVAKLTLEAPVRRARREAIERERANEIRIPAPTGRQEFTGVVVSRKEKQQEVYGGGWVYVWKLVVKCQNAAGETFAVYVSEPSSIETTIGDIVTMRATLKRSDRDESFAFGSRPSNALILGHQDVLAEDALSD